MENETVKVEVELTKPFVEELRNFIAANKGYGYSLEELLVEIIRTGWREHFAKTV